MLGVIVVYYGILSVFDLACIDSCDKALGDGGLVLVKTNGSPSCLQDWQFFFQEFKLAQVR